MFDSRRAPLLTFGKYEKYAASWASLDNFLPPGSKGNGVKTVTPPYAFTPVITPPIPYFPPAISITRQPWEGWRYGANYLKSDLVDRPYGFPDYFYYRSPYCGPCCSCVSGTNPPLLGDPQGVNPNIKYIPFDYRSLLGSGFASQDTSQVCPAVPFNIAGPSPGAVTSCGKPHCQECSGVFRKTPQPTKFQVCIGNPAEPDTLQTCPPQPTKVYLPLSMIPKGEAQPKDCHLTTMEKHQDYEVTVPGSEQAYTKQPYQCVDYNTAAKPDSSTTKSKPTPRKTLDPCGCCAACKFTPGCLPNYPKDPKRCQLIPPEK